MAKKRGLASNRGLDALLGSIKKEKIIAEGLSDAPLQQPSQTETLSENSSENSAKKPLNTSSQADLFPSSPKNRPQSATKSSPTAKTPSNAPDMTAKKATGSSLASATPASIPVADIDDSTTASELNLLHFDVTRLQRGKYQPRIDLGEDALEELATSIRQHGVMQPIVIRPLGSPQGEITHEIIAGERRWRAAQIAGLSHIPAIIRPMSDDLAIALALIENIQREDLSIMEQAVALQRFHDEFGMSHAQIADVVGKARTTVSNLLRLNGLHDEVKKALNDKQLDMGHARSLLSLSKAQQPIIAKKIANEQLTVRQTEQLVKDILNPKESTVTKELDYDRLRLNQQLSEQLGAVVKIKGSSAGKGSIEIFYHNPEELHTLIEQIQGK